MTSMNRMTSGTAYRETTSGLVAVRGARELHILGTSVEQLTQARRLLASHSFDQLFKAGRSVPNLSNTRYLKVVA